MPKTVKKLKLTELQRHRLRQAFRESQDVLNEIRRYRLEGEALADMKTLEVGVASLEVIVTCN